MITRTMKLTEICRAVYNPRKALKPGDAEFIKLARSISEFGLVEPFVFNAQTKRLVSGHQRLSVLKHLGFDEVPCVIVDMDEVREKALNVALNKIKGSWDNQKLALVLAELDASDLDLDVSGFDATEVSDLSELIETDDAGTKEDQFDLASTLKEAAFVQPGDIWTLGKHRLMCADSTNPDDVATLLDNTEADLLLTDPPYNASYTSSLGLSIKNDSMESAAFYQFLLDSLSSAMKHLSKDASAYIFHSDTEGINFRKAFSDAGFVHDSTCIWVKSSLVLGRAPYQWRHEAILYGYPKGGKPLWHGSSDESDLWFYDKPSKNDLHPTAKPIELMAHAIELSTDKDDVVLDIFGGSGATLIAAHGLGRRACLMELDPVYASVIIRRYVECAKSSDDVFCARGSFAELARDHPKERKKGAKST